MNDHKLEIVLAAKNATRRAFNEVQAQTNSLAQSALAMAKSWAPFAAGGAVAAGITGLFSIIKEGTASVAELERRMLRTEALIRATGNAAGFTAEQFLQFANELDLATLGDRDEILNAINAMQTFKTVQGEVFTRAIELSQDLSEVFGTNLSGQVVQLGKALEDPLTGLTALRRVGVSFSAEQKEMIQNFVETNRLAEAQAAILDVLAQQVGGAGKAAAGGLSGALDTLNFRWREFKESMGNTEAAVTGITAVNDALKKTTEILNMKAGEDSLFSLMLKSTSLGQLISLYGALKDIADVQKQINSNTFKIGPHIPGYDAYKADFEKKPDGGSKADDRPNAWLGSSNPVADARRMETLLQQLNQQALEAARANSDEYIDLWQHQANERYQITSRGLQALIEAEEKAADQVVSVSQRAAEAISDTLGDTLFDAVTGKLRSLEDYLQSFLESIQRMLFRILSQQVASGIAGYFSGSSTTGISGGGYGVGPKAAELNTAMPTGMPRTASGTPEVKNNVKINVINQSGQEVTATQRQHFDGRQMVIDVVLDAVNRNVGNMRDVIRSVR